MEAKMAKEMLRIVQTRLDNRGVLKPIEYKTLEICCEILNTVPYYFRMQVQKEAADIKADIG